MGDARVNAFGFGGYCGYVLIADDDQRRQRDARDFVVNALPFDDAGRSACHAELAIGGESRTPFSPLCGARRIVQKFLAEHNRHHLVGHQRLAEPTRDKDQLAIFGYVLFRFGISRGFEQHERTQQFRPSRCESHTDETAHRKPGVMTRREA